MQLRGLARQVREETVALGELLGARAGADRWDFIRSWVRYPLRHRAQSTIGGVPLISVDQVLAAFGADQLADRASSPDEAAHPWGLRALDQRVLVALVRSMGARRVFEIGTFDGGTTALLADAVGESGEVFTLDLPPVAFDATQTPPEFTGAMVGWRFADTAVAGRITQLSGDSKVFDFSPWYGTADVVFVDAGHDHPHGTADSKNALRLVREGGLVVWDDFVPHWWGLVEAIVEVAGEQGLTRIEGTNLAYVHVGRSGS